MLTPNPLNVVNGAVIDNLAQNNIAFGDSGYRDGQSQIVYLFSKDFDLTGQNNVYLVFNSIWEQNQDSIGAVEYSIDEGATWFPLVYYLANEDILRDGDGNIDANATFSTPHGDVATYNDPLEGLKGGYYGAFIGVDSNRWSALAPFIQARGDDSAVDGKRVEVFRMPAADNHASVRLRFAHAGADSWYFGLDNVGIYRLTSVSPPLGSISPAAPTEYLGNTVALSSSFRGIGPFTYQWQHNGADLAGETQSALVIHATNKNAGGTYTVRVGYPGGLTNSSATLTVLDPNIALVTGQWDFDQFDLSPTMGLPLEFFDDAVNFNTEFVSADFIGLPLMNGEDTPVMHFPGPTGRNGYKMRHGIKANGGGTNVNQYTLIMDVLFQGDAHNAERALLQTNPDNTDNRDISIGANNGIGVSGGFEGHFLPNVWQRLAFAVDLSGPGPRPIMAKYINGVKVGQQVLTEGLDARWSMFPANNPATPWALLFADDNVDARAGYVSSIQIRNGRLSDVEIARLGGPSARKIPGAIRTFFDGPQLWIVWSGGVPLQSADEVTGPWNDVNPPVSSPYGVPGPLSGKKFYRPKP